MTRVALLLMLVLLGAATCVYAVTFPDKPPGADFFVDPVALIDSDARTQVNDIASRLLAEERVPIYVVTIRSLAEQGAAGQTIEQYARMLFDEWGIGFTDRNNGMLLLVSKGDRKAQIELGADWADRHNTAAESVMNDMIIAHFKRGDFSLGILDGVRGMEAMARGLGLPRPTAPWWFWPAVIVGLGGTVWLIVNLFRTGRSGWAWALILALAAILFFVLRAAASGGGSGGGFGGGSGGGGGATGSW